jgi:uncharacterized membrane protein (UPF0127 family)
MNPRTSLAWRARGRWAPALLLFMLAAASVPAPRAQNAAKAQVIIHGHVITVEIADTLDRQVRGLSGRPRLRPDEGMLFVYADEGDRVFWMRDMLIPLDIIWLRNRRVVHIEPSVPAPPPGAAPRDLPTYRSAEPANFVLELAAGRTRELGLKPGDRVEFRFD